MCNFFSMKSRNHLECNKTNIKSIDFANLKTTFDKLSTPSSHTHRYVYYNYLNASRRHQQHNHHDKWLCVELEFKMNQPFVDGIEKFCVVIEARVVHDRKFVTHVF